jgi:hypothetical protein
LAHAASLPKALAIAALGKGGMWDSKPTFT